MNSEELRDVIGQLTLEEKAGLCSGADFWRTKAVARLGIPAMMVSDGPHGLRKQSDEADHLGIHDSIEAVCFPAGCASAASFDRALLEKVGQAIGNECQAEDVGILLGPAVNIKRSPLCGRNFEYYSEDPLLAGELAAAFVKGVQSKNVGTCLKHYLANNQETRRMSVSVEADDRTLREIYMPGFEIPIKKAQPWSVMCSYNKIAGVYAAESEKYLTQVLRGDWGFDGFVMSDWSAVNDRVPDLEAGLELEMPYSGGARDVEIVEAVKSGRLPENVLDVAVARLLKSIYRFAENRDKTAVFDRAADHLLARQASAESAVLLKNEGILPLEDSAAVAFIGKYAKAPRFQGGGSSHIKPSHITSAMEAAPQTVRYAQGFDDREDELDEALVQEALQVAEAAQVAVVFAGLPDTWESEGFDRSHMKLPESQNALIERIAQVQPNIVVVLHNGAPVELPWLHRVKGLLEVYLGGEAVGGATVDLLYGKVSPSGRLPETFPVKLEDNPSYLNFPGEGDRVSYREGVFVGYRYYDKKKMAVRFPFGYGLSYTTFAYANLCLSAQRLSDSETLEVTVDVTNTGPMAAKEAVLLFVTDTESTVIRPPKELRAFEKVFLQPGETKTVHFDLDKRAFAYYSTTLQDWHVESGDFEIIIAKSAEEQLLSKTVHVESSVILPCQYSEDSIFIDINKDPRARAIVQPLLKGTMFDPEEKSGPDSDAITPEMIAAMLDFMPLHSLASFGKATPADIKAVVKQLQAL